MDRARLLHTAGPPALVVALWALALPFVGDYANPDGPSYATVALRWLEVDGANAVNGYWGPLLSWATVPLVAVGLEPLAAIRIVLLLGALACLPAVRRLVTAAGAGAAADRVIAWSLAPFLAYQASFGLYADTLMNAALLWSLALALPSATGRRAIGVGALLGVAYLARAYALPVAGVAVVLLFASWWLTGTAQADAAGRLRAALRSVAGVLAGLALVAGPWIVAISLATGEPTFSTSAGFNAELVTPGSAGNPFNVPGLHEPVRERGMSGWEEPSELPVPRTAAAERGEVAADGARFRLELAVANARIVVGSLLRRGAPIVALGAVALVELARRRRPEPAVVVPLLVGTAAAVGLLAIIAIERYLWFPLLATAPAAAYGLHVLEAARPRLARVVAVLTFVVMAGGAALGLLPRVGAHAEVTTTAAVLDDQLDGARAATVDGWQASHHLCFRAGCVYLGRPEPGPVAAVARELDAAHVDVLLVWRGDEALVDGLDPSPDDVLLTVYEVDGADLVPRWLVDGSGVVPAAGTG